MCLQTRNSCAKAFDNRSRSKNLKPKISRGGGGQFDPPPLKASRVKDIVVEELVLSTKVKTHSRSPAEQKTTKGEIMFYALLTDETVTMASTKG